MSTSLRTLAASTLLVASMAGYFGTASAAPVIDHLAFKNASQGTVEFVQWRGGWGWGAPVAGGFVTGALLGGALAAPYYYTPGPYIPLIRNPIMRLRQPAMMLRAMDLRQMGRGRLLRATFQIVQSKNGTLYWDRQASPSMPLIAARDHGRQGL